MEESLLYYIVFVFHIFLFIFIIAGWMSNNEKIIKFHTILVFIVLLMYIIFDGCVITKLEIKLRKKHDRYTILDPILNKLNISRATGSKMTVFLMILSAIISVYKLDKLIGRKT